MTQSNNITQLSQYHGNKKQPKCSKISLQQPLDVRLHLQVPYKNISLVDPQSTAYKAAHLTTITHSVVVVTAIIASVL